MDNTVFFLGHGEPDALAACIAELTNLDPSTIALVPAIGAAWPESSSYVDTTAIQYHKYERADFQIEFQVLLGGHRLAIQPPDELSFFSAVSLALGTPVLFLPTFGDRWFLTRDGSAGKPVNVSMPETYASAGPTLDDRG